MTDTEFKVHWKRLEDKYPNHFKSEDHRSREYADWYDNFHKLDNGITKKAFDYYFKHLAQNWFPELPIMLNCYTRLHREKQPENKDEDIKPGSFKPLYDSIQAVKKRIAAGEVPVGFTDNNYKDGGYPAKYTKVKSMAQCTVSIWDVYERPALAEYRRTKLAETRRNRGTEEMLDGIITLGSGKQINQKLCYYCEKRLIKNNGVFECLNCEVQYV